MNPTPHSREYSSLFQKSNDEFDDEALKLTEALLSVNGECYTMWNYRRNTLLHQFEQQTTVSSTSDDKQNEENETPTLSEEELKKQQMEKEGDTSREQQKK